MRHSSRLALLPVTALALNGCIAAALPALAGGAILNSGGSGSSSTERTTANPVDKSSPLERGIAPSAVDAELGAHPALNEGFASFAQFAREKVTSVKIDRDERSAMLLNPGMLDGERARCNDLPPAVLIDLDDGDEAFALHDAYLSAPRLGSDLEGLRDSGIIVGWVSATNIDHIGAIRYALSQSGLDPAGNDQLLLMKHPDERKQTRREEFGKSHCIIAIAGDRLVDFDELFLFLINSDAAKPLEALVGDGWFITPLALTKQ
ncbi:MAG TPA: hypothetical protein DCS24_01670 [Erythrobacter sp.]|nr:hypothetical protein [Erythrobacter sp.]